jgi:protein-disulfide isomerase
MSLVRLRRLSRPRHLAALLLVALLAAPASADDALPPTQKSAVDQAIHDYLLSHPDVLLEALKLAQQKGDEQAMEQSRRMIVTKHHDLFDDPDDLVEGNPKGDATLIEFFDYRCPYCKQVEPTLDALLHEDGKLRIIYKEFPVLGEASTFATRVALASRQQGKYAAFHHAMMAAKGDITDDIVLKVAASVGLDIGQIKADMSAAGIDRIIHANYDLAEALNIQGTPGFIVGDTMIPGAVDIDTLRQDIAAARKGD